MSLNRRAFLATLAAATTGALLDPERLAWVPGKKVFFDIQRPPLPSGWAETVGGVLVRGDVVTIDGVYEIDPLTRKALPYLKQFVVTEDAGPDCTVKLWPAGFVPLGRVEARPLFPDAAFVKGRRRR